jgi:hypothetical protein
MGGCPPNWAAYFATSDIEPATSKANQLGGRVLKDPFEVGVGHISVVADPHGAAFQFIQLTVPADE